MPDYNEGLSYISPVVSAGEPTISQAMKNTRRAREARRNLVKVRNAQAFINRIRNQMYEQRGAMGPGVREKEDRLARLLTQGSKSMQVEFNI